VLAVEAVAVEVDARLDVPTSRTRLNVRRLDVRRLNVARGRAAHVAHLARGRLDVAVDERCHVAAVAHLARGHRLNVRRLDVDEE
jgi:hypothetical protein